MKEVFLTQNAIVQAVTLVLTVLLAIANTFYRPESDTLQLVLGILLLLAIASLAALSMNLRKQLATAQRVAANQAVKLNEMADRDAETALYTDAALKARLALEIARSRRYRHPLSILMLEVSDFAEFTRTHGRARARQIIHDVAKLLNETLRTTDIVGYNGDARFTIVLSDTQRLQALRASERIADNLARFNAEQGTNLMTSTGISEYHGEVQESLLLVTEARLDQARKQGPNQIVSD